ncbi:hypothetical protein Ocin01_05771 [Orchesella cincta]|uniref:Uncharacterized protein n=1 Tax=Orchesella cincta TaxID=48709 RepID=A0A1D2N6M1_ORCCI|nr:hypothetical protein Ocin01_05771 [Orchesella cincta]
MSSLRSIGFILAVYIICAFVVFNVMGDQPICQVGAAACTGGCKAGGLGGGSCVSTNGCMRCVCS